MSEKGVKVLSEPDDWTFNYPELAELSLDASVAFQLGNSPLPPTKQQMLEQDPKWLADVFLNARLLRFSMDAIEE